MSNKYLFLFTVKFPIPAIKQAKI